MWMELTQGRFLWRTLVLAVLNLRVCCQRISELNGSKEVGCEDGRWKELAQDLVQWRTMVLAVLNLRVLLPEG
jgi:hypothetical protein